MYYQLTLIERESLAVDEQTSCFLAFLLKIDVILSSYDVIGHVHMLAHTEVKKIHAFSRSGILGCNEALPRLAWYLYIMY